MPQSERLAVARGDQPADLVLRGGRVVNVYSGEIHEADIAIADGIIVGLGDYRGQTEEDLRGAYVLPGLLDAHVHIESSLLAPAEFAHCVAPHGTTGAFVDPHEVANVRGAAGVEWMLSAARDLPVRLYVNVPSCVPASPLDESGAVLDAAAVTRLLGLDGVVGLAEMMNYPGVVFGDDEVLAKLAAAAGRPIDGHAPFLGGQQLCAYLLGGPDSDHECTNPAEALEKLRLGCYLLMREGSATRNLAALLPALNDDNARRVCLCCDDIAAEDLLGSGHIDRIVREVIAAGVAPLRAVQMATLNTAERFGLSRQIGAIAPGRRADLVVVDDLTTFIPRRVWSAGQLIAADGQALFEPPARDDSALRDSVHLAALSPATFELTAPGGPVKVIGVHPALLLTTAQSAEPTVRDGLIEADRGRDLLLAACLERHHG
ncbi:MAG: adenine deaminase, partial [Armatimonadetes bacterium]|nr:adenine deaminase [Armatimonadota bacterium]